jgi:hypothetical protein
VGNVVLVVIRWTPKGVLGFVDIVDVVLFAEDDSDAFAALILKESDFNLKAFELVKSLLSTSLKHHNIL